MPLYTKIDINQIRCICECWQPGTIRLGKVIKKNKDVFVRHHARSSNTPITIYGETVYAISMKVHSQGHEAIDVGYSYQTWSLDFSRFKSYDQG